jgi:hypothetical protein
MLVPGIITSLFIYNQSCAPTCPLKWNQIRLRNGRTLHIHHWLLSVLLLPFVRNNTFLQGLLVGGIIHGIGVYDDWYLIYK